MITPINGVGSKSIVEGNIIKKAGTSAISLYSTQYDIGVINNIISYISGSCISLAGCSNVNLSGNILVGDTTTTLYGITNIGLQTNINNNNISGLTTRVFTLSGTPSKISINNNQIINCGGDVIDINDNLDFSIISNYIFGNVNSTNGILNIGTRCNISDNTILNYGNAGSSNMCIRINGEFNNISNNILGGGSTMSHIVYSDGEKNKITDNILGCFGYLAQSTAISLTDYADFNIVKGNFIESSSASVGQSTILVSCTNSLVSDNTLLNKRGDSIKISGNDNVINSNNIQDENYLDGYDAITTNGSVVGGVISNNIIYKSGQYGIYIDDTSQGFYIVNNKIENVDAYSGVYLRGSDCVCYGNEIKMPDTAQYCFDVDGNDNFIIGNNLKGNSGSYPVIRLNSAHRCAVMDNIIDRSSYDIQAGIYLSGSNFVLVKGNRISNAIVGIIESSSDNLQIVDNYIYDCTDFAIKLFNTDKSLIGSNYIYGSGSGSGDGGIYIVSNNNSITNNYINNCDGYGIECEGADQTNISSNTITNCGHGIMFTALGTRNIVNGNLISGCTNGYSIRMLSAYSVLANNLIYNPYSSDSSVYIGTAAEMNMVVSGNYIEAASGQVALEYSAGAASYIKFMGNIAYHGSSPGTEWNAGYVNSSADNIYKSA
jgi:hypothetical protein